MTIFELLKTASEIADRQERINFLRARSDQSVHHLLKFAYDPEVKFLLPKDVPPYRTSEHPEEENNLPHKVKMLFYLIDGTGIQMDQMKREQVFITLLESVSKMDAVLLICVKDKRLPFKNLEPEIINEAFPGLLSRLPEKTELTNTYVTPKKEVKEVEPQDLEFYLKTMLEGEDGIQEAPVAETTVEGADAIVEAVKRNLASSKKTKRKIKARAKSKKAKAKPRARKPAAKAKPKAKAAKKKTPARKAKRATTHEQVL